MKNVSLLYYQTPQSGITEPNKLQQIENLRHENANGKKFKKRKKKKKKIPNLPIQIQDEKFRGKHQ